MNNEIINHAKFFLMEFFRIHIFMTFSKNTPVLILQRKVLGLTLFQLNKGPYGVSNINISEKSYQ